MTEDQRIELRTALQEVHDQIHGLYPKGGSITESDKQLRHQLLIVDLVVHLADEVIGSAVPNEQLVAERTANLLYAVRLIVPDHPFEQVAKLLLNNEKSLNE